MPIQIMEHSLTKEILLLLILSASVPSMYADSSKNNSVSAIYVFGDSTVDPGNNNYLSTIVKSNFPPYGMNFPRHVSTGRFSNGKLTTDFIASYLGIKDFVPPYLNKSLNMEDLISGVSFASSASGYDPLTAQIFNVVSMPQQIDYFKEYKEKLEQVMGTEKLEGHIQRAIFVISCGTNDFSLNYFLVPIRRKQYTVAAYQKFLIGNTRTFLQSLFDMGARKIVMVGLPPVGCLPLVITESTLMGNLQRQCVESFSTAASQYNQMQQHELQMFQNKYSKSGIQTFYAGIYDPIQNLIRSCLKSGFVECTRGCCGTGELEVTFLCNRKTPVCSDPSKFIFWDSVHPTEIVYYKLFLAFRDALDTVR